MCTNFSAILNLFETSFSKCWKIVTLQFYCDAENSGKLKIILNEGETAGVGDVACTIDTSGKSTENVRTDNSAEQKSKHNETSLKKEKSIDPLYLLNPVLARIRFPIPTDTHLLLQKK